MSSNTNNISQFNGRSLKRVVYFVLIAILIHSQAQTTNYQANSSYSINLSIYSILGCLFYLLFHHIDIQTERQRIKDELINEFNSKIASINENLSNINNNNAKVDHKVNEQITFRNNVNSVLVSSLLYNYNPTNPLLSSLSHFKRVQYNTNCIFAKTSILWGSPNYNINYSIEDNVKNSLTAFIQFTMKVKLLYKYFQDDAVQQHFSSNNEENGGKALKLVSNISKSERLDGFVIEVIGENYCNNTDNFGETVRRVLTYLSNNDPVSVNAHVENNEKIYNYHFNNNNNKDKKQDNEDDDNEDINDSVYIRDGIDIRCLRAMNHSSNYIATAKWHFSFLNEPYFVTTFAPCYGTDNARHSFADDETKWSCYVLFQPEFSFAAHNISPDTPHTRWTDPKTERDFIRIAYKNAGREYDIPDTIAYPTSFHLVPPLRLHGPVVKWWKGLNNNNNNNNDQENSDNEEEFDEKNQPESDDDINQPIESSN